MVLSCRGGNLLGYAIPPFDLERGQVVSLIWPGQIDDRTDTALAKTLAGQTGGMVETNSIVMRSTHVYFTRSMLPWAGIRGHCNGRSFKVTTGLMTLFGEFEGCHKAANPMCYAGNDRAIIGIELAFKKADVVVFDAATTEFWPVYNAISRHLALGKSAIEISLPIISRLYPWDKTHPDAILRYVSPPRGTERHDEALKAKVVQVISRILDGELTREEAESWAVEQLESRINGNDRSVWHAINALAGASFQMQGETWSHSDLVYQEMLSVLRSSVLYNGPVGKSD